MLAAMFALIAIGIAMIYASGNPSEHNIASAPNHDSVIWQKQAVYAGFGLIVLILLNLIDYRWLGPLTYWIYAAVLLVLAALLAAKYLSGRGIEIPFIPQRNGTFRWLRIGSISIQPSEFCKIAYILALAWYLRFRSNYQQFKGLIGPFTLTMLAMVLILFEPDLGTVLLMMPILFSMLYIAGAQPKHLVLILLMGVICFPFLWGKMNHYQRQRISSLLLQSEKVQNLAKSNKTISEILTGKELFETRQWERTYGWQPKHSKLAIASGGTKGYGFRTGPYIKYNSLPERHNDFIFAIIAHQWGFLGCILVLGLYTIIIACANEIAWHNTDPFARLISVGIIAMFAVQVIVNIAMTLGLMPVTGLTLPLISYGGSSLIVSMVAIGLLNSIGKERPFSVAARAFESNIQ
ncbi:MAG: rod shape-determining protein RodA [Anaerohalosphaera sp.]|nr:rod shape-determining protein RodA [Anaerohalosphaera sp.]